MAVDAGKGSEIRGELEAARSEFHQLLDRVVRAGWDRPSTNRSWTNGQLMFHIALGFFLLLPLTVLMRMFAALPRGVSRLFAACLNAGTPLFNRVNALGPRIGARIVGPRRLDATFDAVLRRALRRTESMRPGDWKRGMHYPTRWEPRFSDFMTFEDLFRYPSIHMRHHATQISDA